MMRRQARERREYVYRKMQEDQERAVVDRKRRFREAFESGKALPTDLRQDAAALQKAAQFDDERTAELQAQRDDEYRSAGVTDPKVVVTTSRDPSSRLKQFAKEVRLIFPNAQRMNRGGHVIEELVNVCRANEVTDLVIVHEHRGEPDGLIVCHLPHGPTAFFELANVVMRHDIPNAGTVSEAYPHLVFHNLSTRLGERFKSILKYLFPVPKDDSRRVITFANDSDYISFRHHNYTRKGREIELAEVGPRFEMKPYQITLGTADQKEADVEWVSKPFMNTAKKRKLL